MKKIFNLILFSIAITVIAMLTSFNGEIKAEVTENKTAMQTYVEAMQPGWNLGNTFEASPGETSWGNPITTKALIDEIAAQGFKSIRIPIRWDQRMGTTEPYTIDESFLTRVKEVVDWSLDAGLYVMINMHHEEWVMKMDEDTHHVDIRNRYDAAWTQIADYFKDYDNKLMFESINEPRFDEDWNKDTPKYFELINELNTSFHDIVRSSGGNNDTRPLVLPTLTCSTQQARLDALHNTITNLDDDNIIVTVHYYGHWPFSVNIAGATTFNSETKADIDSTFNRVYDTFVSKGIPVILGEYGLLGFDSSLGTIQQGEKLKYFEYLTYYVKEKGITHMLWDNGQHFNRRSRIWSDEDLYNIIMASMEGRSSNAASDFVYIKKGETIVDEQIKLNLNGNTLINIKNREQVLVNGTDYELSGDTLTLKASLLDSIITDSFGTNATLTLEFNTGADWNVKVIYYDTPTMESVNGFSSNYRIPTNFNGDRLATIHATYKSGNNAGPQNWTPFKEFDRAFKPDYFNKNIHLTSNFFNEVNNGDVILKMHFWSGDIVEYTFTKNGSSITGVSSNEPPVDEPNTNDPDPTEPDDSDTEDPSESETPEDDSKDNNGMTIYIISGIVLLVIIGISSIYFIKNRKKSN
jgi:endoglucanase